MKAISQDEFGGPEVLKVVELERPQPLPTEVLVRVHAAGVNPVDYKTREGSGMAGVLGEPPFVLGWDLSGVVEELGFGVHTLEVGDEVYGMPWFPRQAAAYAEYVTAPARQFAKKLANLTHAEAAAIPLAGLTAWQILTAATTQNEAPATTTAAAAAAAAATTAAATAATALDGQRVLIHAAAGGVGHLAVQFAKHLGAYVIGTASKEKHDWLLELGADELIDYHATEVGGATGNVDLVVDLIGSETTLGQSVKVLKRGGLLVAVPGGTSAELLSQAAAYGVRAKPFLVEPDGHALGEIAALVEAGAVKVEVEQVFPLEAAAEAHRRMATGRTRGKLVLDTTS